MIPRLLVVFLFVESSFAEYRYCVIYGIDRGAVLINTELGKDDNFRGNISQIGWHTTQLNFTVNAVNGWEQLNSENKLYVDQPVLDYRWQNFLTNSEVEANFATLFLNDSNTNVFFSVRLFPKSSTVDPERNKWLHLKFRNGILYTEKNSSFSEPLNNVGSPVDFYSNNTKSLWKLHKYNYLSTQSSSTELLYKNNQCKPIDGGCLSLYVAACDGCVINLRINSSSSNTSNTSSVNGTGQWITTNISLANFPNDCFNLFVKTRTTGDVDHTKVYWTIGDIGFVTVNQTCETITRYFQVSADDINKHNLICEDSSSNKINFTSQLLHMIEKKENSVHKPHKASTAFNLFYLLIIIPVALIVAGVIMVRMWTTRQKNTPRRTEEHVVLFTPELSIDEPKKAWQSIKCSDFQNYVYDLFCNKENKILLEQFSALPSGYLKPADEGKLDHNIKKNRYIKILPYDENRVVLKPSSEEYLEDSDYINASYIKGSHNEKEYISTQNPLENTITDFFRMIWQEEVKYVVMISGKDDKFFRYWPMHKTSVFYLDIEVCTEQFTRFEFYDHRVLQLHRNGKNREIQHFHFHAWSQEVFSSYIFSEFIRHLLTIPKQSTPIVFHCRAGIGRSGTIMLSHIALCSGKLRNSYNFYEITKQLRQGRLDLVPTLNQYKLAHLIVYEVLSFKDQAVALGNTFQAHIRSLFEGNSIKKVWSECLEEKEWIQDAITPYRLCTAYPKLARYADKNKQTVEHSRVFLQNRKVDYIHAMFVKDYKQQKHFIVSQHPLQNTIEDFWIMIIQNNVCAIFNLNEVDLLYMGDEFFFPTLKNPVKKVGAQITIKCIGEEDYSLPTTYFTTLNLEIDEPNEAKRNISFLNVKNWTKLKAVPDSTDIMMSLWKIVNQKKASNRPVLVCCDDGITSSGLVTCFFYMADKMSQQKKCDILGSVRAVRRTHMSFINFEQFVFLHNCALEF